MYWAFLCLEIPSWGGCRKTPNTSILFECVALRSQKYPSLSHFDCFITTNSYYSLKQFINETTQINYP
jgi:hypothetical protein